jgi:hypothetical protein
LVEPAQIEKLTQNVTRYKRIMYLVIAVLLAGVALLVTGLTVPIMPVMIAGSVCCGLGFLGNFYGWTFFAIYQGKLRLLRLIESNRLTTIEDIAASTGKVKSQVKREMTALINGGYLPGWRFNKKSGELVSTEFKGYKCPHCGAPVQPEDKICIYCGTGIRG